MGFRNWDIGVLCLNVPIVIMTSCDRSASLDASWVTTVSLRHSHALRLGRRFQPLARIYGPGKKMKPGPLDLPKSDRMTGHNARDALRTLVGRGVILHVR